VVLKDVLARHAGVGGVVLHDKDLVVIDLAVVAAH
jgi:hypothetical protein